MPWFLWLVIVVAVLTVLFVAIGRGLQRKGQPLCIIEAMKMMNEIESPAAGRVIRILAENGNPIEYGQPLMIIEVI